MGRSGLGLNKYLFTGLILLFDELVDILEGFSFGKIFEGFGPASKLLDEFIKCHKEVSLHFVI